MESEFISCIPVLPSSNIPRDVKWYEEKMGLTTHFSDSMYAVLYRGKLVLHLQWHADSEEDPLLGGSVVRIMVKNIQPLFDELQKRGTVAADKLRMGTPWKTNEFGFFDPNQNAIFIMEEL